jgi:hypothetical protein
MTTKKRNRKKAKRKAAGKKAAPRKKPAKKAVPRRNPLRKKAARRTKKVRGKSENIGSVVFEPKGLGARSGGQSGDLQGLSGIAGAGSESVEELLEEGNAFEAELVKGVEDAGDADEGESRPTKCPKMMFPKSISARNRGAVERNRRARHGSDSSGP